VRAVRGAGRAVVLGSGPVAVGAVLELIRLGVADVEVVTSRSAWPPGKVLPGVRTASPGARVGASLVIDATGRPPGPALSLSEPGGVLGLLGTPEDGAALDALAVHRANVTVVGMHELAGRDPAHRAGCFARLAAWCATQPWLASARGWWTARPGAETEAAMASLRAPHRRTVLTALWWTAAGAGAWGPDPAG
jgi:threonine dehydrogenase-like Zn-dependent dehydrogenase